MIDLPDHGYASVTITPIDPAGVVDGSLGGPSDIIDRPGYRYSVQFTTPMLPMKDARIFQTLLEQGARDDVSYPWPVDTKSVPAGAPLVNGASPTGSVIPIKGLIPNFQFKLGQPLVVISEGVRFVHKASAVTTADLSGDMVVPVFPFTRKSFLDADVIEIGRPRIGGVLSWQPPTQPAFGARSFTFTITERY